MKKKFLRNALLLCAMGMVVFLLPNCSKETTTTDDSPDEVEKEPPLPPKPTCPVDIEWVYVKPGEFMMGAPDEDDDAFPHEYPQHQVKLKGFWMSATLITFAQYDAFCKATKHPEAWDKDYGKDGKRATLPVFNVTWEDAMDFCGWAGVQLPTEAQWEYACRAGTTTKYSWGDTFDKTRCNAQEVLRKPSAVKTFPKNPWGLYDMHGNLWEWCSDYYDADYYKASPVEDPHGPESGKERVARGGSWMGFPKHLRSSNRWKFSPKFKDTFLGFRVVVPVK